MSRPKMRVWSWPMWPRWTGCGSAPGTASSPAAPVDAALQELRKAADAEDLPAVDRAAAALNQAVGGLRVR